MFFENKRWKKVLKLEFKFYLTVYFYEFSRFLSHLKYFTKTRAEVGIANFFLSPLIANPLIFFGVR
jgi:hypothetical protein